MIAGSSCGCPRTPLPTKATNSSFISLQSSLSPQTVTSYLCASTTFSSLNPSPMVSNETTGINGAASTMVSEAMPYLSTQPEPEQTWQITLTGKVIAITGVNRGIGLGIAEVCLANSAKVVHSLDLMDPSENFAVLQRNTPISNTSKPT